MSGSPSSSGRNPSATPNWQANISVRKHRTRTVDLAAPTPLPSDDLYTSECLNQRIDYAKQRLQSTTRYLTPNSRKLLTIYHDACWDLHLKVNTDSNKGRKIHLDTIRKFETDLSTKHFLNDVSSSDLLQEVINLRRQSFLARYGDYTAYIATKLRQGAAAKKPKTQYAEKISGQFIWTGISKKLKEEAPTWRADRAKYPELVPTCYAVYANCRAAGIQNADRMMDLIHLYAERNAAFHRGIKEDLETQNYARIAQCIHEDLRDLASVCPPSMADEEIIFRALLEQMRDDWFDTSFAPDQPGGWSFKPAIREVYDQLQKKKAAKDDAFRKVAERAANRLQWDQENEELLVQAVTTVSDPFKLPPPGPEHSTVSSKGKAKASIASDPVDVSDRRKAWDTIMKQQTGQLKALERTLSQQRRINRIVSAYRATYGEDAPP